MAEPNNTPWPSGTPVPASTPRSASPAPAVPSSPLQYPHRPGLPPHPAGVRGDGLRPIVLHIGDPIRYNPTTYAELAARFDVVRPGAAERARPAFLQALRERRWGDFVAVFRPFWGTGGEMGPWDAELIGALPESCRVFAFAGAGFDWADTKLLGERGAPAEV